MEAEKLILEALRDGKPKSQNMIRRDTGKHYYIIKRAIVSLIKKKFIKESRKGNITSYSITEKGAKQ